MNLALHFHCAHRLQEKASSHSPLMERSKKGSVYCKKPTSNQSKLNQEEILSLLKRIQTSISKGESPEAETKKTKNQDESSYENKPLTKAILDVLEKSRKNTEGPKGKLPVTKSSKALGEKAEKEEESPLIETMKLAELKEVAKNRGIKGYSKLKKSELLKLLRSYSL